jgi:hypothetical protein
MKQYNLLFPTLKQEGRRCFSTIQSREDYIILNLSPFVTSLKHLPYSLYVEGALLGGALATPGNTCTAPSSIRRMPVYR